MESREQERGKRRRDQDRQADLRNGITRCSGCIYYRPAGSAPDFYMMCHYALDTGRLRGIRPADCYRRPGGPYRPRRRRRGAAEEKEEGQKG